MFACPLQGRFLHLFLWSFILSSAYSSLRPLNAHTEGARGDQVGKAKSTSRSSIKENLLVGPKKQEHKARGHITAWVRCCLHFLSFQILLISSKTILPPTPHFFATERGIRDLSSLSRDQTCVPCTGSTVLTTRPPGKSPNILILA